jgi:glucose-1-phosphate thymidylyltransferase
MCVILGDNIIENNISAAVESFRRQPQGAHILLKEVDDPERFGCPEIVNGRIVRIEEKPKRPKTPYAVTGLYLFDSTLFDKIRTLKPSARGELEITDVNNLYLEEGRLNYSILEGWWTDAGTFESLRRAANLVAQTGANKVGGAAANRPASPAAVGTRG